MKINHGHDIVISFTLTKNSSLKLYLLSFLIEAFITDLN